MTKYNEGDLLEAVKGETVIRGRANKATPGDTWVGDSNRLTDVLKLDGFTITVIERAAS